jgi:hypothetical protein
MYCIWCGIDPVGSRDTVRLRGTATTSRARSLIAGGPCANVGARTRPCGRLGQGAALLAVLLEIGAGRREWPRAAVSARHARGLGPTTSASLSTRVSPQANKQTPQ